MTSERKRGTYHHGSLREALIEAADAIIRERGLEGFSLREATRRAGVSPGAPKHHFGGVAGLLTAVAARGFDLQATYMAAVPLTGNVARDVRAMVFAFVCFALEHPEIYRLMFRWRYHSKDAGLDAAVTKSLEPTARLMAAYDAVPVADDQGTIIAPQVTASMATAHGLALMAVELPDRTSRDLIDQPLFLGTTLAEVIEARWPDR